MVKGLLSVRRYPAEAALARQNEEVNGSDHYR